MKKLFILLLICPLISLAQSMPAEKVPATTPDPNATTATASDLNKGATVVTDGASPQKVCEMCKHPTDVTIANTKGVLNTSSGKGSKPPTADDVGTGQ